MASDWSSPCKSCGSCDIVLKMSSSNPSSWKKFPRSLIKDHRTIIWPQRVAAGIAVGCPKEAFRKRFSIPCNLTNFIYYFYGLFDSVKQQQQKVTVLDLKKYLKKLKSPFWSTHLQWLRCYLTFGNFRNDQEKCEYAVQLGWGKGVKRVCDSGEKAGLPTPEMLR